MNVLRSALLATILWSLVFAQAPLFFIRHGSTLEMNQPIHAALSMSAEIVTVANSTDVVNGNTSNMINLTTSPGTDGISFREALLAANNTAGVKIIEFATALTGSSIYILAANGAWPSLTSGDLTIQGDINGDGTPDITLDGSQGAPNSPTGNCLHIWSSNNIITGLKIDHFGGSAIGFGAPGDNTTPFTMSGNNIFNNTIVGSNISIGPFGLTSMMNTQQISDLTWSNMTISGNHLTSTTDQIGGIALIAAGGTATRNHILNITITNNTLSGYGVGIMAIAADTNSAYHGGPSTPIYYADNNHIQGITITNNQLDNILYKGIEVGAGNFGNRGNQIEDVVVQDNLVIGRGNADPIGITIFAACDGGTADRTTSNNILANVTVNHNQIEDMYLGIKTVAADTKYTDGSPGYTANQVLGLKITNNIVKRTKDHGIIVMAGRSAANFIASDNQIDGLIIQGNQVLTGTENWAVGIRILGGWAQGPCPACVTNNSFSNVKVIDNQVTGFDIALSVIGGSGEGAVGNTVSGYQSGNDLTNNNEPWQFIDNLGGAIDNSIDGWLSKVSLPLIIR